MTPDYAGRKGRTNANAMIMASSRARSKKTTSNRNVMTSTTTMRMTTTIRKNLKGLGYGG